MKACLMYFLLAGMLWVPGESRGGTGGDISSNVPLNEINIHAYRHFHRLFSSGVSGEYWFKSEDGYQVSFFRDAERNQAFFDRRGAYLYSLKYYAGAKMPALVAAVVKRGYPGYQLDVVTEVTDGEKVFYLVKVISAESVKTLSVNDGKIDVLEDLVNGGVTSGPGVVVAGR
ncbi:MAG: hypothetical protein JST42_30615 [Bacteroidetes bacterium]|nr:hypothetical protein [Bacteroidota bacterium]